MTRKKTVKYLFLIITAVVLVASVVIYREWTKPRQKVEDTKGISISAAELAKAYKADEHKADSMYANKTKALEVPGTVAEIDKNQDGGVMILLSTEDPDFPIQCTMRDKNTVVQKGQKVTVKGFCSGSSITGVLLTDCILQQS